MYKYNIPIMNIPINPTTESKILYQYTESAKPEASTLKEPSQPQAATSQEERVTIGMDIEEL